MVAQNFKFLYRHYKDKQEVLAQMFHVHQSDISAYINGKKPIPTDILNRISVRYNVSVDDLMNKDLSLEYDSPQMVSLNDAAKFGKNMLPILVSNVAKTNDKFKRAYEILISSLQLGDFDSFYGRVAELEYAIRLFQEAWEESGTYVALSNSLSTILLIYTVYSQRGVQIGQELLCKGEVNSLDIESSFLRDPNKPEAINPYEEHKKLFFEKYEDTAYGNIKLLKSNTRFSELGDFYLAVCNVLGFAEDFIDYQVCSQTGLYMLIQLSMLDNQYAEKFLESLPPIS